MRADVAELADALRSGRSEGDLVRVRISSSAPTLLGYRIMVVHLPLEQAVEVRILVPQPIKHFHSHAVVVFFMWRDTIRRERRSLLRLKEFHGMTQGPHENISCVPCVSLHYQFSIFNFSLSIHAGVTVGTLTTVPPHCHMA